MTISMESKPLTVYQVLKSKLGLLSALRKSNHVKKEIFRDLKIYEEFMDMKGGVMERCEALSKRHNLHQMTIYTIVCNLKKFV